MKALYMLLALVVALTTSQAVEASQNLLVTLSTEKPIVNGGAAVRIQWEARNTGTSPLRLLRWYMPDEPLENNVFSVLRNGEPVRYRGKIVKRSAPSSSAYVDLAPGDTIATTLDISVPYRMTAAGRYTIQYRVPADVLLGTGSAGESLSSDHLSIDVANDAPGFSTSSGGAKQGALGSRSAPAPAYNQCSEEQRLTIARTLPAAKSYARRARRYLQRIRNRSTNFRYQTWFGEYLPQRYQRAIDNFHDTERSLYTRQYTFDCSEEDCESDDFAYTYGGHTIYLCSVFWDRPKKGFDSRAGTIVHEATHIAADTNATTPEVYGFSDLELLFELARERPSRAVRNADSYEHFAESLGIPTQNWLGSGNPSLCGKEPTSSGSECCALCGNQRVYEVVPGATCSDCSLAAGAYCDAAGFDRGALQDASMLPLSPGSSTQCQTTGDLCAVACTDGTQIGRIEASACRCAADANLCADHGGPASVDYGGADITIGDPCAPTRTNGLVAYSQSKGTVADIYTIRADGTERNNLSASLGGDRDHFDFAPAWSPDGLRIAFESNRGGIYSLFVANGDGSGLTRVTFADSHRPDWSPDNRHIVFYRYVSDTGAGIPIALVVVDTETLTEQVIYNEPGVAVGFPRWSPDGSRIAFERHTGSNDLAVYVINPDGSGLLQISEVGERAGLPLWSPDGTTITYGSSFAGVAEATADGTSHTTHNGPIPLAWAPDGTRIVTYYQVTPDPIGLVTALPDGSDRQTLESKLLAGFIGQGQEGPSWQPVLVPPE